MFPQPLKRSRKKRLYYLIIFRDVKITREVLGLVGSFPNKIQTVLKIKICDIIAKLRTNQIVMESEFSFKISFNSSLTFYYLRNLKRIFIIKSNLSSMSSYQESFHDYKCLKFVTYYWQVKLIKVGYL